MLLNSETALLTPRLLLRPYRKWHVERYHAWMSSPALREETASELLSIEEEYEMQESWRVDEDKLTFIIHSRISGSSSLDPNFLERHGSSQMIGDVNLFLSSCDIDEEEGTKEGEGRKMKAEMEIMLAEPDARRKGYALETLRAFLEYSSMNLSIPPTNFFARVSTSNVGSIALFEQLGFRQGKTVEVFQEVELVHDGPSWSWSISGTPTHEILVDEDALRS